MELTALYVELVSANCLFHPAYSFHGWNPIKEEPSNEYCRKKRRSCNLVGLSSIKVQFCKKPYVFYKNMAISLLSTQRKFFLINHFLKRCLLRCYGEINIMSLLELATLQGLCPRRRGWDSIPLKDLIIEINGGLKANSI